MINTSISAPDTSRRVVKLAASIDRGPSARRQSTEFEANATMVKAVATAVRTELMAGAVDRITELASAFDRLLAKCAADYQTAAAQTV